MFIISWELNSFISVYGTYKTCSFFQFPCRVPHSSVSPFPAPEMLHVWLFASLCQSARLTRQVSGTVHDLTVGKINLSLPSPSFMAAQLPPLLLKVYCLSDVISPVTLLSHFSYRFLFFCSCCLFLYLVIRPEISLLLAFSLLTHTVALPPSGSEEG